MENLLAEETKPKPTGVFSKLAFPKKPGILTRIKFPTFSRRGWGVILGVVSALFLLLVIFGVWPLFSSYRAARRLESSGRSLVAALKTQNLEQTKSSLQDTKSDLLSLDASFSRLSWTRFIPILGGYWSDAHHLTRVGVLGIEASEILIPTLEPYADILGFDSGLDSQEAGDGAKTAEDRVNFVVETIDEVVPKLDQVGEKFEEMRQEVSLVNPSRYPEKIGNTKIREPLRMGVSLVNDLARFVVEGKPLIENVSYLLGVDETRTYLVLFQNDKELRPTGGFITAYTLMQVEDGEIAPVVSGDIYALDSRYSGSVTPPEPLVRYIKGPYLISKHWFLRDMNWSPDFSDAMQLFAEEVEKAGIEDIDGIISVNTEVLVRLLDVTGPIGVPGYGTYSTEEVSACGCPQVIYELETFADVEGPVVWDPVSGEIVYGRIFDNRKAILGPLVNSVLANALGQPKDKVPALFEASLSSLLEKHVLFYMFEPKIQEGFEAFGLAGSIKDFSGDYLHINDANLGGRKSNLYVQQEVSLEVKDKGKTLEHVLEITYKNPKEHDGWLNSVLPNWVRIYVPQGAELVEIVGLEDKEEPYEESGKTVFAGFFELRPLGVAKITLRYQTQKDEADHYRLLIQKQPGTQGGLYSVKVNGETQEFKLTQDKEIFF